MSHYLASSEVGIACLILEHIPVPNGKSLYDESLILSRLPFPPLAGTTTGKSHTSEHTAG